jgi:hypothetical protein
VGDDVSVDSETLLMTDLVNLNIKPAQYFKGTHKDMICIRVFIYVDVHTSMSIYVSTVFLKIETEKRIFGEAYRHRMHA